MTDMPDTPLPHPVPVRLTAAVLAAGEGRRLGGRCKALITIDGRPQLARLWDLLHAAGVGGGVVITGAHAPALRAGVAALGGCPPGWRLVHHAGHADGQPGSVRVALAGLLASETPGWDQALLLPCDLPLLRADDVRELCAAWDGVSPLLRPVFDGQPAHPLLLTRAAAQAVLDSGPEADVRAYLAAHPAALQRRVVANDRGVFDLDTPDDLLALRERTGWSVV